MNSEKLQITYLRVIADMKPQMQIIPLKVIFNETEYNIDSVIDIKYQVVMGLGKQCYAYYCKIKNHLKIIYLDSDFQWFVIKKASSRNLS